MAQSMLIASKETSLTMPRKINFYEEDASCNIACIMRGVVSEAFPCIDSGSAPEQAAISIIIIIDEVK